MLGIFHEESNRDKGIALVLKNLSNELGVWSSVSQIVFHQTLVNRRTLEGIVGIVNLDRLAVIEEHETPIGSVRGDVQIGILRSRTLESESAVRDDGRIDGLTGNLVYQKHLGAILEARAADGIFLYVTFVASQHSRRGHRQHQSR